MGSFLSTGTRTRRGGRLLRTPAALLAILAVAVLAVVTLVPGGRHQVALSVSRVPSSYLELYFAPGQRSPRCGSTRRLVVRFRLVSHLQGTERVRYVVRGDSARSTGLPVSGRTTLSPGGRARVQRTVAPPRAKRYRIVVRLPGRAEALSLRCQESAGRRR